jgi:predicted nicotinamide N-methyase
MSMDQAAFIADNTEIQSTALLPEIRLHLASEGMALWQMSDEDREAEDLPLPYWAFAWAGGQALARHLLDNWEVVRGKRVLDIGAGSGVEAIAAAMAGAAAVTAVDVDPFAIAATSLNADLNGMDVHTWLGDPLSDLAGDVGRQPKDWDVVMVGDLFFEQPLARELEAWLRHLHRQGVEILIGDPQRTYLPRKGLEKVASYAVQTTSNLEDSDLRNASVWRMVGD